MTQILPRLFPYIPERKMFSVKYSPQCLRYKVTKLKKKKQYKLSEQSPLPNE